MGDIISAFGYQRNHFWMRGFLHLLKASYVLCSKGSANSKEVRRSLDLIYEACSRRLEESSLLATCISDIFIFISLSSVKSVALFLF